VLGGGAYFEAGLSHEMAVDLAQRGAISPSELQLVAATAAALRLNSLRAYRRSGGAEVIAWRFCERACERAGGRRAARALAEIASLEAREVAPLDAIARAADLDPSEADKVARALMRQGLVRAAEGGYALASEWSRSLVRGYTAETRGRGVAARLLLRRKIEGGGLLAPSAVREVRRFAGALGPDEDRVVRRSVRVALLAAAAVLAMPVAATAFLYNRYSRSYFLDAEPAPSAPVVERLGRPGMLFAALPHRPPFGAVLADSGFARGALKDGVPEGAQHLDGDAWLRRLVDSLRPLPRGAVALILDGNLKPLADAYQDSALRPAVVLAVGAAGRGVPDEVALLKKALADPAEDVRRGAVQAAAALLARTPGSTVDVLVAGLKDASPSVRGLALAEIGRLPDADAAPLLASVLGETSDPVVRRQAIEAIGAQVERTPQAAAALGRAMSGPARAEAAAILSRFLDGSGPAAEAADTAVAQVALDAKAPEEARLEALRLLRRRPTAPAGIEAIAGTPKVLAAAMPLIARAKPEDAAAKVLEAMHGQSALRAAAAAAIGLLPRTADTPKQLKSLEYDSSVEVRVEAMHALPVLGREALPLLVKEAKGGGADVERAAVETMGAQAVKLGVSSAVQALEATVKGARSSTRRAAIEALGRIAEQKPSAAAGALGRLVHDKVPEVRADAAGALGDLVAHGSKEAISALRAAGRDPDPATRRRAAGALGRARGATATTAARALAPFAVDAEAAVRVDAAAALGALGAPAREAGVIVALVGDRDPSVRAAARRAAEQMGAPGSELDRALLSTFASGSVADRIEIATTAGIVGASSTVRAALADADAAVRRAAAEHAGGAAADALGGAATNGATTSAITANGAMTDPPAAAPRSSGVPAPVVAALVGALGDADAAVRVAAVRGLVGAKAATALAQAARSPDLDVRVAALAALGDVGGAVARATLESALVDASERARVAAIHGLVRLGPEIADRLLGALGDSSGDVREAAVTALGVVWATQAPDTLAARLRDETNGDARFAAALALARQADGGKGAEAKHALDEAATSATPAARLTARIARAFIGRADAMAPFVHILRAGG
jgi:HEAT repeat protein